VTSEHVEQPAARVAPGSARRRTRQATAGRTRTSLAFNSLIAGAIVLVLLLVFILENTQSVKISYFGAGGHISLGVALLLAAVGGALLVGLAGIGRVFQLRRRLRRHRS
jgi:uncharacterized integral membrane protein